MIYDQNDDALIDDAAQYAKPGGAPAWANWVLTVDDGLTGLFGDDIIAGGSGDDTIFGQLGNDTIQGDGIINIEVAAQRESDGTLTVLPSIEDPADGDDYIETNGGDDVIFGNLGQDDIIGGSSNMFGLNSSEARPDSSDLIRKSIPPIPLMCWPTTR